MTPTFRYNPAVLAQAFATLGCLYPDRIIAGFGTGEALNEIATGFRGAGEQDWPEFKERFARLRESVRLMRELWNGDRVNFEGEYYSTHDASIYDRARGRRAGLHRRGRSDGREVRGPRRRRLHLHLGQGRRALRRPAHPRGEGGRRGGRPLVRRHRPHDRDQALLRGDRGGRAREHPLLVAASLSKEQKHDITDPVEMERAADALPIEQIAKRWIVGTDPDEVVAQIGQYVDWGFNHLVFHAPGPRPAAVPRAVRARPGAAPAGALAGRLGGRRSLRRR